MQPKYLTQDELAEIQKRCDAATPGPWQISGMPCFVNHLQWVDGPLINEADGIRNNSEYVFKGAGSQDGCGEFICSSHESLQFIAHSRQDIPNLLHTIKVYRTAFEHLLQASSENYTQVMYLYEVIENAQKQLQPPDKE